METKKDEKRKPLMSLRPNDIKGALWNNENGEKKKWPSVSFERSYVKDGENVTEKLTVNGVSSMRTVRDFLNEALDEVRASQGDTSGDLSRNEQTL